MIPSPFIILLDHHALQSSSLLLQGRGRLLARPQPQPQPRRRPRELGMRLLRAGVSKSGNEGERVKSVEIIYVYRVTGGRVTWLGCIILAIPLSGCFCLAEGSFAGLHG